MWVLYAYLILCYIMALPIIWLYYYLAKQVRQPNIWEKTDRGSWVKLGGKVTWQGLLFFFVLAPIVVPWWIIGTIRANIGKG